MMTGARNIFIFSFCILSSTCYLVANSVHYVSAAESTDSAAESDGMSNDTDGSSSGPKADDSREFQSIGNQGSSAESMDNDVTYQNQRQNLPSCTTSRCSQREEVECRKGNPKHQLKFAYNRRILGIRKGFVHVDASKKIQATQSELVDGRRELQAESIHSGRLRGGRLVSTDLYEPIDTRRGTLEAQSTSNDGGVEAEGVRYGSLDGGVETRGRLGSLHRVVETQGNRILVVTQNDGTIGTDASQVGSLDGSIDAEGHLFGGVISESNDGQVGTQGGRRGRVDGVETEGVRYNVVTEIDGTQTQGVRQNVFTEHDGVRNGGSHGQVESSDGRVLTETFDTDPRSEGIVSASLDGRDEEQSRHGTLDGGVQKQSRYRSITHDYRVDTEGGRFSSVYGDVQTQGDRFQLVTQNLRVDTKGNRFGSVDGDVQTQENRFQLVTQNPRVDTEGSRFGSLDGGVQTQGNRYLGIIQVDDRVDPEGDRFGLQGGGDQTEGNRFGAVTLADRCATEGSRSTSLDSGLDAEGNRCGSQHLRPGEQSDSETGGTGHTLQNRYQVITHVDPVDEEGHQFGSLEAHVETEGGQYGSLDGSVRTQETRVSDFKAQGNRYGLITPGTHVEKERRRLGWTDDRV